MIEGQNRIDFAKTLKEALSKEMTAGMSMQADFYSKYPAEKLCEISYAKGDLKESLKYLEILLSESPNDERLINNKKIIIKNLHNLGFSVTDVSQENEEQESNLPIKLHEGELSVGWLIPTINPVDPAQRIRRLNVHNELKSKENVKSAGLENTITLKMNYVDDAEPPIPPGFMITNPPYGERIKINDIKSLYSEIGDALKKRYSGYTAWIISSNLEALKYIGLRPSRNITVYSGKLECKFAKFEMYTGTKNKKS